MECADFIAASPPCSRFVIERFFERLNNIVDAVWITLEIVQYVQGTALSGFGEGLAQSHKGGPVFGRQFP